MSAVKMLAVVLILVGSLGVSYGRLSYIQSAQAEPLWPMEYAVRDNKQMNLSELMGISAIIAGLALLLLRND